MQQAAHDTIGALGEDALLAQIFPLLPTGSATLVPPGDDAAVVRSPDGRVVVSTDVLVEGRHFRREWSSGADVGWRAAMQNLADIAAMGARPTAVVVGLVAPAGLPVAWVLDLAHGLQDACDPHDVGVVGGDLSAGSEVVVSVTVLGDLAGAAPVLRSGARPGDVVALAGTVGRSAAGLALLTAGRRPDGDEVETDEVRALSGLVDAYRRPVAPLAAGVVAARSGATAMLDVSDGLLRDAGRVARASGVQIDLTDPVESFADDLAVLGPAARSVGADARHWVLGGGEDHGLLATFPAGVEVPEPFRVVGRVVAADGEQGPVPVLVAGERPSVDSVVGWDHFGGQPRR